MFTDKRGLTQRPVGGYGQTEAQIRSAAKGAPAPRRERRGMSESRKAVLRVLGLSHWIGRSA